MKRKLLALGAFVFLAAASFAQVSQLGEPLSWRGKLSKQTIQVNQMPAVDMNAINAEDAVNDLDKSIPWRFGYNQATNITLANGGTWQTLPNGSRIWRTEIISDGALTINLLLDNVHIPNGARLDLYNIEKTSFVGSYTSQNNHPSHELGTELVHGDHIVVEYFEPKEVMGQGHFTITDVVHGYRSLNLVQNSLEKALNSSGACNVDARCPLDPYVGGISAWDDQIRSVAMIVVNGSGICTGALINNTCNDGYPYFLTANHCLGGGTGNWLFRFNWDVPESAPGDLSCQTGANTPTTYNNASNYNQTTVNGATVLVSGGQADHALLDLDNLTPAMAQTWGLFYAGWNIDDTESAITEVTGIHHPSGDIKKICRALEVDPWGTNGIYHATNSGAATWEVNDWENGVTEPGSSGSPLFDQNGRIIGQLYGGAAACSGTNDNNAIDYYGRLGVSWGLGIGTYLAPTSCGTAITNDGYDPNVALTPDNAGIQSITEPSGSYCTGTITPQVTLRNYGTNNLTAVTINYDVNGGTNNTFSWTGSLAPGATAIVSLPAITVASGSYTFNASTSMPNGVTDTDPSNDASLSTFTATVGGQAITLTLETDCWGYETYWEIVDAGMSVVASGGNTSGIPPGGLGNAGSTDPGAYPDETTITETFCLATGCYDFVIYDDYGDGLAGIAAGCGVDGDYTIEDGAGTVLVSMTTADFGNSATHNFCVNPPCNSTYTSSTIEEDCNGDNDGSITVSFVTGNQTGATYDIGNGPQSNGTFSNLPQGTYNVTVIDGDACTSVVSVTLGGPTALTSTVASTTDEMSGNDGTINVTIAGGNGNYSYAWTGPNGYTSTSEDLTGLAGGTYNLTVTDGNGCTSTLSATINSQVGLNENVIPTFALYPNPSEGIFYVDMVGSMSDNYEVVITDVSGRIVMNKTVYTEQFTIDLSNASNGTYFLNISSDEKKATKTIIKK